VDPYPDSINFLDMDQYAEPGPRIRIQGQEMKKKYVLVNVFSLKGTGTKYYRLPVLFFFYF
jgi:hypothetical protein